MATAHSPSHRASFPCRIALEDFSISVQAGETNGDRVDKARWEELQVTAEYNGVKQKTRWLSLPLCDELRQRRTQQNDDAGSADSSLNLDSAEERGLGAPYCGEPPAAVAAGLAKLKDRCVELALTQMNNCSFVVWFNVDPEATAASAASPAGEGADGDDSAIVPPRPRVKPKRVHFLSFAVEGSNASRLGAMSGGTHGDKKPTSANKEAIAAAASKSAAKVSAWAKSTFFKLSSRSVTSKKKAEDEAAREQVLAQYAKQSADAGAPEKLLESGEYATVISGVDPSDAYNAPDGRRRFQLLLKPARSKVPMAGAGVPVFISFTMVAKFAEEAPIAVPRNFHGYTIVANQMVLDLSEAAQTMVVPGQGGQGDGEQGSHRRITGYGFGLTSNAVVRDGQPTIRSAFLGDEAIHTVEGSNVRLINFPDHHRSTNERDLTDEDYAKLPTSVCVLSAACTTGNRQRVGRRRITISRFKTSPTDGLCKPSYKCQLLMFIRRQLESGEVVEEPAAEAIDLAGILNQEYCPAHVRRLTFSQGETMYVRLCRYCFADPVRHRSPQLMPYDFDNTGVEITAEDNEPVAGWIIEANAAAHGHTPARTARRTSTTPAVAPPQQQQQEQQRQQQQDDVSPDEDVEAERQEDSDDESTTESPLQAAAPPSHPLTMEERMMALGGGGGQPGAEEDSPPTPPLGPDNPFVTQASTTFAPEPHATNDGGWNPFITHEGAGQATGGGAQGMAFVSEQPADSGAGEAQADPVHDDDFFGDWGSAEAAAAGAPAFEVTFEDGDNPFLQLGGGESRGNFGAPPRSPRAPVEKGEYYFGEGNGN